MSLVIRLSRVGRKGEGKFRVVVKERRSKRDGASVDILGYFQKTGGKISKKIDADKIKYWTEKGALLSQAVQKIVNQA